ncbi:uncharacterized protein EURHEDRAFT_84317 [Aspergillus ruber CBS 135680]|uniref:Uncharacterized protein n=1 Tax=Aspergillus ruber (strain CBS 135680) TaxID=1388766 RepID=A0A017SEQ8_ASPRC|nr:uncharacterized protein EURHEDRAFT_84317 [Aspergillus ruber CBS 135680]EYE94730.1 hypothetical protein EURHEDRAFT_84317 [Aspergillus ruber CBS 135680]
MVDWIGMSGGHPGRKVRSSLSRYEGRLIVQKRLRNMIRTRIMLDTEWLICLVFWYHCTVHGGGNRNRSGRDGELQFWDV